jgi:hypothetical protein
MLAAGRFLDGKSIEVWDGSRGLGDPQRGNVIKPWYKMCLNWLTGILRVTLSGLEAAVCAHLSRRRFCF